MSVSLLGGFVLELLAATVFAYSSPSFADKEREEYVTNSVDIDFSRRLEVVKAGEQYEIKECHKEECLPLKAMPVLSLSEAQSIALKHRNGQSPTYGSGPSQFFFDLSKNLTDDSNPRTKVVLGKIINDSDAKAALYYLKPTEDIASIIKSRSEELKLRESPSSYILRKVCNEAQCRPFTGVGQDFNEVLLQIKKALR